jgi:hypothetical protein
MLSRSELRDVVDARALEQAGYRIEDAIPAARAKDGGLTPAQLAWVLSQIEIDDNRPLPASVTPAELRRYITELVQRLTRLAFPQ